MSQRFFIREVLVGERPECWVQLDRVVKTRALSLAYFCQHCGNLWFRADNGGSWKVTTVTCGQHGVNGEHFPPGTIILPWVMELRGDLPLSLWKNDFEAALLNYERIQNEV